MIASTSMIDNKYISRENGSILYKSQLGYCYDKDNF